MNQCFKILIVFLISTLTMQAQPTMKVDAPNVVDMSEEYFQIRFIINDANVSNFTPPSLKNFEILSGPYSSVRSSSSYINGKAHHESSTTYTYTLAPKAKGDYTIEPASATVNGKTIHSQKKSIKITGDGKPKTRNNEQHQSPSNANVKVTNKDLFINVTANRKKIYEQEPVMLTYKFYARPDVMLSQIGLQKKPDFKGMLSQDIPVKNIQMNLEDINGRSYRSGVIQKYVIFPQGSGKISVPGVTFTCDVMQRDASIDPFEAFFNGGGTITKTLQRSVEDIELEIRPLPQPKPANFSGGVGQFSIKGEWLTSEFKTNDVATYRITVEGTGNLRLITAPVLSLSDDFDSYTPKTTDQTTVTAQGITGSMIYEYTFVPRKVGDYKIPAIEFCYFNPETEKYQTVKTEPKNIHVAKGERTNEEYQRSQNLQRSDIRDLHNSVGKVTSFKDPFWWGDWSYWLIYVLILAGGYAGFAVLHGYAQKNADVVSRNSKKAGKMAAKRLKTAKGFMQKNMRKEFYTEVAHALYGYVAHKYNLSLSELNRDRFEREFKERGVDESYINQFVHLLDECDFAQYAPSEQVMGMQQLYDEAIQTIVEIEKQ